jgi:hypothetical protein
MPRGWNHPIQVSFRLPYSLPSTISYAGIIFDVRPVVLPAGGGRTDARSGIVSAGGNARVRCALMRVRGAVSSVVYGSKRL